MGAALDAYVGQRLPAMLLDRALAAGAAIEVHGIYPDHVREVLPGATLADRGHAFRPTKAFNRVRPHYFAHEARGARRIVVAVPPGRDYVLHYASLVGHFLRSRDGASPTPAIAVRYPAAEAAIADWTGLSDLVEQGDRVLIGYVQELVPLLAERGAEVVRERENEFYGAARLRFRGSGEEVCALGVRFSFWGCISARLAAACRRLGARELVYAGKLGALTEPRDIYRRLFAPSSFLHLAPEPKVPAPLAGPPNGLLELFPELDTGVHMSVATVLEEDMQQRAYGDRFGVASIDNEIAQIALALVEPAGEPATPFSALHFATDYLRAGDEHARHDVYNLTNHRRRDALALKTRMLEAIADRLAAYYRHRP
jgi:hypothetical protein